MGAGMSDGEAMALGRSAAGSRLSLLVNLSVLVLIFWGCLQLDGPLAQSARALQLRQVLWVEWTGDFLYLIGTGGGLVTISALFLAAGYASRRRPLTRCGIATLVAHAVSAVIVQIMKRTIGRPRPRLVRDDEFFTGPSWVSGLDSFPSGHAAASFAVAAVVAASFPRWRWPAFSLAGLIVVSRVVRASHYATDVVGGMVVGMLVGSIVTRPAREWGAAAVRAISSLTPGVAIGFALAWLVYHPVVDPVQDAMARWVGVTAVVFGLCGRWGHAFGDRAAAFRPYAAISIGVGLALTTGSWLVVLIAVLIAVARWPTLASPPGESAPRGHVPSLAVETTGAAALLIGVLLLQGLKGALAVSGP